MNRKEDAAHIYQGIAPTKSGKSAEGGVFHNPGKDNWALFGRGFEGCKPVITTRFKSDQMVELTLHVVDNGRVGVGVWGYWTDGRLDYQECVWHATGVRRDGVDNRCRRVTAVAQKGGKTVANSGSYIQNVEWDLVKIGRMGAEWSGGALHSWASADTKENCVFPDTAKVYVDFRTFSHEIIRIDLR